MKSKKGFMLVETITVVVILSTVIISLFTMYSTVLTEEKRKDQFDDTAYIYNAYFVEKLLSWGNLKATEKLNAAGGNIVEIKPEDLTGSAQTLLEKLYRNDATTPANGSYNISHIYLVTNDAKNSALTCVKTTGSCTSGAYGNDTNNYWSKARVNLLYYVKTLPSNDDATTYRVVIEYEVPTYNYNSKKTRTEYTNCQTEYGTDWYENDQDKTHRYCMKVTYKYYYANIKFGGGGT